MANAATIAGLAFSNAFVGVNHALAHAVGARFGIAHGRANGVFLPHVLRYNASLPSKFMPAPGYSAYVAPEKYAQIACVIGLGGHGEGGGPGGGGEGGGGGGGGWGGGIGEGGGGGVGVACARIRASRSSASWSSCCARATRASRRVRRDLPAGTLGS